MIKFTRQPDNSWKEEGEFAAAVAEVAIKIGDKKPTRNGYTLDAALKIVRDAIAKGQVKQDSYAIVPIPEPEAKPVVLTEADEARVAAILAENPALDHAAAVKQLKKEKKAAGKPAKEPKAPKAPKEPKAPKAPKEAKGPRIPKYDVKQFAEVYAASGNSVDAVVTATGASKVYVQRALTKLGVYVAPVKAPKEPKAPKAPRDPNAPGVARPRMDEAKVDELYAAGKSFAEIAKEIGASPVGVARNLTRRGKVYATPAQAPAQAE